MFEQLKKQLKEIVEIADQCPEQYREKCFSILLEHFLSSQEPKELGGKSSKTIDVSLPDNVHNEFSKFIEDHNLTEVISSIFHLEDGKCEIIVKDLKTKDKAPAQVRSALLLGIKHLAEEGVTTVPNEELRQLCSDHAVLDSANFPSIMKKNKNLFLPTKKKGEKDWKLTKPGEIEAAKIIKELAGISE